MWPSPAAASSGSRLAYELATRGAQVTVIDAGHPGRATDAGAGILAPETHPADETFWWEMACRAGEHYPLLLERLRADGISTEGAGYARCGLLSVGLRESEDSWFAPFADRVTRRSGGRCVRSRPPRRRRFSHRWGRSIVCCTMRMLPVSMGAGWPPHCAKRRSGGVCCLCRVRFAVSARRGSRGRGRRAGACVGGGRAARKVQHVTIDGHDDLECGAFVVAGGAWSAELGEFLGCPLPITPTKGQIVHLGTTQDSDEWPIVQPLLTHYLVPWPGGRVACGGTFEAGAGFSATVTAAGLHELLRECLAVAPGLADAEYLSHESGAATHLARRSARRRGCSGLGERMGGDGTWGERVAAGSVYGGAVGRRNSGRDYRDAAANGRPRTRSGTFFLGISHNGPYAGRPQCPR